MNVELMSKNISANKKQEFPVQKCDQCDCWSNVIQYIYCFKN